MTAAAEKLYSDVLALPEADRAELAERLLHALAPGMAEDDPGFLAELDRRKADYLSGRTPGIPMEEAMAELDAHLAARRK